MYVYDCIIYMCVCVYIYIVNDIISCPLPFLWVSHCSPTTVQTKSHHRMCLGKLRVSNGALESCFLVRGLNISFYILKLKTNHL